MPWRELVLPAVKLARDGVQVDAPLAKTLNQVLSEERIKSEVLRNLNAYLVIPIKDTGKRVID